MQKHSSHTTRGIRRSTVFWRTSKRFVPHHKRNVDVSKMKIRFATKHKQCGCFYFFFFGQQCRLNCMPEFIVICVIVNAIIVKKNMWDIYCFLHNLIIWTQTLQVSTFDTEAKRLRKAFNANNYISILFVCGKNFCLAFDIHRTT